MSRSILLGVLQACFLMFFGTLRISVAESGLSQTDGPNIVFLVSEDPSNYKSVQTIPVLAGMLRDRYGCRCIILEREEKLSAAQFPGLEVIRKADLVVVFFRRCALPEAQIAMIRAYLADGKPLVGIRTANRAIVLLSGSVDDKVEPVVWARTHQRSRIFYTSLGHPDDFKTPQFIKLLVNAMFWAMDQPVPRH